MGWETWKPYLFEIQDKNTRKLTGIDVEIVARVLQEMGCKYVFIKTPWSKHLKQLQIGKIDLAASASRLPEREDYAYFSEPYRREQLYLFTKKETLETFNLKGLKDIIGTSFRLGVVQGFNYGEVYNKLAEIPGFQERLVSVMVPEQNLENIILDKIDGFLDDPVAVSTYLNEGFNYDSSKLNLTRYPFLINDNPIFIMFSKSAVQQKYVDQFNSELKKLQDQKLINQIINNYVKF
ncbi:MAG: substrate-binding periplasmic protein [Gammaproteobacteria bacterium]